MKGKKIIAACAAGIMTAVSAVMAGCGGPQLPPGASEDTVVIEYAVVYDTYNLEVYRELVDTYNNGQGLEDEVYVVPKYESGTMSNLTTLLARDCRYNVVTLYEDQFKQIAALDYLLPLDSYLTADVQNAMQWSEIPEGMTNRLRFNATPDENGRYTAGTGTNLVALPIGDDPQVLYYNTEIMGLRDIVVISVAEEDLEAYNAEHGTNLKAHGYAEYTPEFVGGDLAAEASLNENGQSVVKVFNNRIPMSWEELRCLAKSFQTGWEDYRAYEYGYLAEWWFNYGWSVGGDCIGWNEETGEYELTVTQDTDNFLVLADDGITVNGTEYAQGDILFYEDAMYLNNNASEKTRLTEGDQPSLYIMPSQYDAILEFESLMVPETAEVDDENYGYGVASPDTSDRSRRFLTGNDCPLLNEAFSRGNSYAGSALAGKWDMAPLAQYREFEGGRVYYADGITSGEGKFANEYLKVIGEEYDGEVYTGDVKTAWNDTPIVGEAVSCSRNYMVAIPRNSDSAEYDAAMKFVSWLVGPEGQKILAQGNTMVPNQTSYAMSAEYLESEDRLSDNVWAAAFASQNSDIGDWAYFDQSTWINNWSSDFNGAVRLGQKTLTEFFNDVKTAANNALALMNLRIYGR